MPRRKGRKRMSGYQFFYEACLREFKEQCPDNSICLPQVSSICAENWRRVDDETKKRFQDEADAVNRAKKRTRRPAKVKAKRQRSAGANKAKLRCLRKRQPKKPEKGTSVAKKRGKEGGPPPPKPKRQGNKVTKTKTGLQGEAVKTGKRTASPEPQPKPKKLKKVTTNAAKKEVKDEAVKTAKRSAPSKPQGQPKKLKKEINVGKKGEAKAVKKAKMVNSPKGQSKKVEKETAGLKVQRPVSAFIHFSREFRSVIKRDHPELGFGQISGVLAEMWRKVDENTKMMYKQLSLKQSELYRKEKNAAKLAGR